MFDGNFVLQSINGAHKDWITGLSFMPGGNALLSGCRGGILKVRACVYVCVSDCTCDELECVRTRLCLCAASK